MSQTNSLTLKQWIKQRRRALNLTQKEAAAKLRIPKDTYRRYEDGSRRVPADIAQHMLRLFDIPARSHASFLALAAGLGVAEMDGQPPVAVNSHPRMASHISPIVVPLPATPLFGRAVDIAAICHRFTASSARFITLTGPPGVGKTRLATEVAAHLTTHLSGGVHLVDLTAVMSAEGVLPALARALEVRETPAQSIGDTLAGALRTREMLLVLDNFEHVLDAARDIADLVACCPKLRVLVTSRERLRVRPEQHFKVAPLAIDEAIAFFIDRAHAANPDFQSQNGNAALIQRICERLDCLPLALELAAAACDDLDISALWRTLDAGLGLPPAGLRDLPARQHTLMAAIAWSYRLLTPALQRAFTSLSAFVGGFDAESAAAMGVSASQLDRLCAKNLVQVDRTHVAQAGAPMRYRLLETLREFALAHVTALDELRARHANHFGEVVRAAGKTLAGGSDAATLRRWVANLDNLRAALEWLLGQGAHDAAAQALSIASDSHQVWRQSGLFREGLHWLERALAKCDETRITPGVLAEAYRRAGFLSSQLGEARCFDFLKRASGLFERAGDGAGEGRVLMLMGMLSRYPGNRRCTERFLDASMRRLRAFGSPADQLPLLMQYILLHQQITGDAVMAAHYIQQQLTLARELNATNYVVSAESAWGMVRLLEGDVNAAEAQFNAVLRSSGVPQGELIETHLGLGQVAERRGDWTVARMHFEASLALIQAQGLGHGHTVLAACLGRVAACEGHLDEAQLLFDEGLRNSLSNFDVEPVAHCLAGLAFVATHRQKDHAHAARYLGAARAVRDLFHIKPNPCDAKLRNLARDGVVAAIGRHAFDDIAMAVERSVRAYIPNVEFDNSYEAKGSINLPQVLLKALDIPMIH